MKTSTQPRMQNTPLLTSTASTQSHAPSPRCLCTPWSLRGKRQLRTGVGIVCPGATPAPACDSVASPVTTARCAAGPSNDTGRPRPSGMGVDQGIAQAPTTAQTPTKRWHLHTCLLRKPMSRGLTMTPRGAWMVAWACLVDGRTLEVASPPPSPVQTCPAPPATTAAAPSHGAAASAPLGSGIPHARPGTAHRSPRYVPSMPHPTPCARTRLLCRCGSEQPSQTQRGHWRM